MELKDSTTLGILHSPREKLNYFKLERRLGRHGRIHLVQKMYDNEVPESMLSLSVEEFLREIQGKKTRHIWLETVEPERKELAFLSIAELKTFLKNAKS